MSKATRERIAICTTSTATTKAMVGAAAGQLQRHEQAEPVQSAAAVVAEWLGESDGLLVCAGAGMGVDSGLPDFRGNAGFWRAYPALESSGLDFMSMANPVHFSHQPRLAWGFYGHRLALYRQTQPHAGFAMLQALAEPLEHGLFVFTSNVDGQFQTAGVAPQKVLECHGSIHYLQCSTPCSERIWSSDAFVPETDNNRCVLLNELPECPVCAAVARPNILMFGDDQWLPAQTERQHGYFARWLESVRRPLIVEIGAGTAVATVRRLAQQVAQRYGARMVRINPDGQTEVGEDFVWISSGACAALTAIRVQSEKACKEET